MKPQYSYSVWYAPLFSALFAPIAIALAGLGAGCTAPDPTSGVRPALLTTTPDGQTTTTLWADWDDVDAALDVGLERSELATTLTTTSDDTRTWELLAVSGTTGHLTIQRLLIDGRDARGCEHLRLTATVNSARGPDFAARLLSGTRARLDQLAGVPFAPVR